MRVLSVAIIALALVSGILPQFTDCQSQGKAMQLANGMTVAMKCHWTARGEIALAVPLVGMAGALAFSRRKETARSLGMLGVILGAFVMLLPTALIGVCTSGMPCNTVMRPTLLLSGGLIVGLSLVSFIVTARRPGEEG
jgi:hypothetical protein